MVRVRAEYRHWHEWHSNQSTVVLWYSCKTYQKGIVWLLGNNHCDGHVRKLWCVSYSYFYIHRTFSIIQFWNAIRPRPESITARTAATIGNRRPLNWTVDLCAIQLTTIIESFSWRTCTQFPISRTRIVPGSHCAISLQRFCVLCDIVFRFFFL